MGNQDKCFEKDTKIISIYERNENNTNHTLTKPRMPTTTNRNYFGNSNVYRNCSLYDAAPISISSNEDQYPTQQTIMKGKPNQVKSRYMDYLKNENQPTIEKRPKTNPTPSMNETYNTIPIYRYKKDESNNSDENENHYALNDHHAPKQNCDQLDRRSRLCNLILHQQYSMAQLPVDGYNEGNSLKENPSVKSGYMELSKNSQDEKPESSDGEAEDKGVTDSSHSYEHGESLKKKPEVKSRYMDFYYKGKKPDTCDIDYQSSDSNAAHVASENLSDDQSPRQAIVTQKPNVIKSRYMDWNKDQSTEVIREERKIFPQLDWNDFHRLHSIHNFLDEMQYNFPSLCTTGVIGSSLENRDLKVLKVSNSNAANTNVWIDAGIHAREWIAPAVNTYIINYIVNNFNKLPKSIQNKDWYFLPVMNPDGYEFSHTNYRMWRKNKARIDNECVGVDLNRNFSVGWGCAGSSDDPKSQHYRGSCPFSEPESRAVRDMLKSSGINFKVYITLHSYGEVILFPFAYRAELCADYVRLLEGATVMSKAINAESGSIYKVGISRDVMHGAAGTSCDWSYEEAKIPFCYLLELRSKKHKFRIPEAINAASGSIYKVGISRDVMHGVAGTCCDWSYEEAKIPFCYLLELRSKKHKFRIPEVINAASGSIYKVGISRDVMHGAADTCCDWSYEEAKIPFCYLLELRSKKHKFRIPELEIEDTGK